jgi:catecholate siderophore receptor
MSMPTRLIRPTPIAALVHVALLGAFSTNAWAWNADDMFVGAPQEVRIVGSLERGYDTKTSSTATKTDTLLRDTPQAITVLTKEIIQDQAMRSIADVVRYVPGMNPSQGEGNRDAVIFRGNNSTSDFFIDGIRDDVQYFRDFYNIDSIEALKGSNAMIFGRGGSGGVINRVTKQPVWNTVREASLSYGSWASRRATIDLGQAVNENVAVRVNAMAEDSDSYRQDVNVERAGINPTVAIRAGKNTHVTLGYEHFRDDRVADRGVSSLNGRPYQTDVSTFFGDPGQSPTSVRVHAFTAVLDHDFGNGWSLRNRTRYADYDKFYQNVYASSVVQPTGMVNLGAYNQATQRTNLFNQTDLTTTLQTGAIRHTLLAGLELGRQETDNLRQTGYLGTGSTTAFPVPAASPRFSTPLSFRPSASDANNHGVADVASVYVQDQMTFSPQWQAVVGVRYDRFDVDFRNNRDGKVYEVKDSPLSPRVGLVYKPVEAVSLYASYSMAYVPRAGEQLASLNASNAAFDPEQFRNIELGAKWDIQPNLSFSGAVYKLKRSNVVIAGPTGTNTSILADGQESKGLELGLTGKLTPNWDVMGGYAYQDAKLTATVSSSAKKGATLAQVPKHSFSLWNRYAFSPSLAAGLGVVYRDSIFTSTSNAVELPSYVRVDGALFYTINEQYKVQLNVENLFDKKYYASAHSDTNILPGAPRAVRLTLNAKF